MGLYGIFKDNISLLPDIFFVVVKCVSHENMGQGHCFQPSIIYTNLQNPPGHSSILDTSPKFSLFLRKDTYERFQKIKLLHGDVSSVFLVQSHL